MPTVQSPTFERVYKQIENSADYHLPSVYSFLTWFQDEFGGGLTVEQDPQGDSYIPLSTIPQSSGANAKKFIVGVLPPSCRVTGRKLNRVEEKGTEPSKPTPAPQPELNNGQGGQPLPMKYGKDGKPVNGAYIGKGAPLTDQFWVQYVLMCERLGVDPNEMARTVNLESGFNTSAYNVSNNKLTAQGMTGFLHGTALTLGMSEAEWQDYTKQSAERQLYWIEKFFAKEHVRGMTGGRLYSKNLGDGNKGANTATSGIPNILYAGEVFQEAHPGNYLNAGRQKNAYNTNSYLDANGDGAISIEDIDAVFARKPPPFGVEIAKAQDAVRKGAKDWTSSGTPPPSTLGTEEWQTSGSDKAKDASKQAEKTANTTINANSANEIYLKAQDAMIKATLRQLDNMSTTPPLRLLVNPNSFKVSTEKVIADGDVGRNGTIVEHWGELQTKIDASGKLAAFYALEIGGAAPGLTRTARNLSLSFLNFMSLYLLYKNNGALWIQPSANDNDIKFSTLSVMGSIYIYYDNVLYIGSFDTFTISETDTVQFSLDYSFSFTARAIFELDNVDDPLQFLPSSKPTENTITEIDPSNITTTVVMTPSELEYYNEVLSVDLQERVIENELTQIESQSKEKVTPKAVTDSINQAQLKQLAKELGFGQTSTGSKKSAPPSTSNKIGKNKL